MFSDLALNPMERSGIMIFEFYAPQLPIQSDFESSTCLHRLQMFPNVALNPMERSETMIF